MDAAELVKSMKVVELSATTRRDAIRDLAEAANWANEGIPLDRLLEAIDEREATAQTVVAKGFALPHAVIDWDGGYRVVVGRSRGGIAYGVPQGDRVQLLVLFVVGKGQNRIHVELLGALAELFEPEDFRRAIVEAPDAAKIAGLLRARVGLQPELAPRRPLSAPRLNAILVRQAIQLIDSLAAQALLLAVDGLESVPWAPLLEWPGRVLVVSSKTVEEKRVERPNTHVFEIPHAQLSGLHRAQLGMLLAASEGLLSEQSSVVCVTGASGRRWDSVTVAKPDAQLRTMFDSKAARSRAGIRPAVILRVLSLAIELASEGREGQPVGAMFVIGDTRQVMRHAHQMVLNPFHGFSRPLRNILDPSLAETIKEFALIDGAFIVQADGMVRTAGAYLVPQAPAVRLPKGLGTRHQAAAAITAQTRAMAIAVSESTGAVTVFRNGAIVLSLQRATPKN